ncbi:hypothetical protein Tco_0526004 [Tanacetum coccineum]
MRLVSSCLVIFDLEPLSLSFDFVFCSEIFKSFSLISLPPCVLTNMLILCITRKLSINLPPSLVSEERSLISEFYGNIAPKTGATNVIKSSTSGSSHDPSILKSKQPKSNVLHASSSGNPNVRKGDRYDDDLLYMMMLMIIDNDNIGVLVDDADNNDDDDI